MRSVGWLNAPIGTLVPITQSKELQLVVVDLRSVNFGRNRLIADQSWPAIYRW